MLVEIVSCSVDDCMAAERAGAARIELCQALGEGGLTPSIGLMMEAAEAVSIPIMAMVRGRRAGFSYSPSDLRAMARDVTSLLDGGAKGVVFGCLTPEGRVDVEACGPLLEAAGGAETVFHRAFDVVPDPFEALETLCELGFARVLTSGQRPSALDGIALTRELVERAAGRIEILPAGGLRPSNARSFAEESGCDQIHLAPLLTHSDASTAANTAIRFGAKELPQENAYTVVDEAAVAEVVRAVRSL